MYCLRVFYKNYIVYYNVYCGVFIEKHVYTKFRRDKVVVAVSYMPIYVPIVMYGLRPYSGFIYKNCITEHNVAVMVVMEFYQFVKFHFLKTLLRYAGSWLKLKKSNKMKNCENELKQLSCSQILVIFRMLNNSILNGML